MKSTSPAPPGLHQTPNIRPPNPIFTPPQPMPDAHAPIPDLTWAALLGRWMEFARSSVALPPTPEGDRWRRAVAPIITLQAVTFALSEVSGLPAAEAALGVARADVLIENARRDLLALWSVGNASELHPELGALLHDAGAALDAARAGQPNSAP